MSEEGKLQGIAVREASRAPMQEHQQAEVTVEEGIVGDYRGSGLRQVTFLAAHQWRVVEQELDVELPWHTRRANLLIDGIDLSATVGKHLQIGACLFAIHGETDPCERMDELQPGLRQTLTPSLRAGVWGKVLQGGTIKVGQRAQIA